VLGRPYGTGRRWPARDCSTGSQQAQAKDLAETQGKPREFAATIARPAVHRAQHRREQPSDSATPPGLLGNGRLRYPRYAPKTLTPTLRTWERPPCRSATSISSVSDLIPGPSLRVHHLALPDQHRSLYAIFIHFSANRDETTKKQPGRCECERQTEKRELHYYRVDQAEFLSRVAHVLCEETCANARVEPGRSKVHCDEIPAMIWSTPRRVCDTCNFNDWLPGEGRAGIHLIAGRGAVQRTTVC
jgi:hypothetical protein